MSANESICPTCDEICAIEQPAEPDVGLFGNVYGCPKHGEFFIDHDGRKVFCQPPLPTPAERALLLLVLQANATAKEISEARNAVFLERLSPGVKARWQGAYRAHALTRRALQAVTEACLIPDGFSLVAWRNEVDEALDAEDAG